MHCILNIAIQLAMKKKERFKNMAVFSIMLLYSFPWNHFHVTEVPVGVPKNN